MSMQATRYPGQAVNLREGGEVRGSCSVLIPDGEDSLSLSVARCLARVPGVQVSILSSKRWSLSHFSHHPHRYEYRPMATDDEKRLEAVVEILDRYRIDVLLPVSEEGAEFVAAHRQLFAEHAAVAPIPSSQALATATDKWLLAEFAGEHQLPTPSAILVTCDSAFDTQLAGLEYPVVLKPRRGAGGQGIEMFHDAAGVRAFLERQGEEQFKNKYILQSYVPGLDLGLSALCRDGKFLAFTIQQGLLAYHLGRLKAMQFINQEDVLKNGTSLLSALGWDGVAHVDMRYDSRDGQVKIIEVNGRFWGSLMGSFVVGVNFPYLACRAALNIPFPMPDYQLGRYCHPGAAIWDFARRLVRKNQLDGLAFQETGLPFYLADPLPETVRTIYRLCTKLTAEP